MRMIILSNNLQLQNTQFIAPQLPILLFTTTVYLWRYWKIPTLTTANLTKTSIENNHLSNIQSIQKIVINKNRGVWIYKAVEVTTDLSSTHYHPNVSELSS